MENIINEFYDNRNFQNENDEDGVPRKKVFWK